MILNTTHPLTSARKRFRDAFNADPDFERVWIDNLAMFMYDSLDDERLKDKAFRDALTKRLLKLIF